MALQKTSNFKGIDCNYWRINSYEWKVNENKTYVLVALYKDKATRTANVNNYVNMIKLSIPGIDLTRAQMYPLLLAASPLLTWATTV